MLYGSKLGAHVLFAQLVWRLELCFEQKLSYHNNLSVTQNRSLCMAKSVYKKNVMPYQNSSEKNTHFILQTLLMQPSSNAAVILPTIF